MRFFTLLPVPPTSIPAVEQPTNANSGMSMTTPQPQPFSPPTMFPPFTSATPDSTGAKGTLQGSAVLLLLKASRALAGSCVILSTVFLSLGMVFSAAKPAFAHEKYFKICNKTNQERTIAFGAWMGAPANIPHTGVTGQQQGIIDKLQGGFWYSKGWYRILEDTCVQVARGHEFGRYVYLYVAEVNDEWTFGDGKRASFCVERRLGAYYDFHPFFIAEYEESPYSTPDYPDNLRYTDFGQSGTTWQGPNCKGLELNAREFPNTFESDHFWYDNLKFHRHDIGDSDSSFTWNIYY